MSRARVVAGVAALALSGLGVFGLQAPAYANHRCPNPGGQYPQGQCDTEGHGDNAGGSDDRGAAVEEIHDGTVTVRCHGKGYKPASKGFCYAKSTAIFLGSLTADSAGVIDGSFEVSATQLPPGLHHVILVGIDPQGRPHTTVTALLVVVARGPKSRPGGGVGPVELPRTGAEIATVSVVGLALVGGGAVTLASGRRRRTAA